MYKNKILNLSKEDKLLLLCTQITKENKFKDNIIYLVHQDIDWEYLLRISSRHGLIPLLYRQFTIVCPDEIPFEVMLYLKEFVKNNAKKNLFFLKELIDIQEILNDNGIKSIPYKGPVLAQQLYGNLNMRQFGDIDIFIKKDDFTIIKELLISKGYLPKFNLDIVQERNYINSQRELTFINNSKGVYLELHWKFSSIFLNLPIISEKKFLENLDVMKIGGVVVPTISPENLILILSIHNASHYWNRLAWLVDIATLISDNNINWSQVLSLSERLSIKKILLINLYLCKFLLGSKIDKNLEKYFLDDKLIDMSNLFARNYFSEKLKKDLIYKMKISFNIRESNIYGLRDVLSGVFKPSFYELNNLKLPPYLFFLYYIYRPYNLLKRYELFENKNLF